MKKLREHHHLGFKARSESAFYSFSPESHLHLVLRAKTPCLQTRDAECFRGGRVSEGLLSSFPSIPPQISISPGQERGWMRHCSKRTHCMFDKYQDPSLKRLGRRKESGWPTVGAFIFWCVIQKMDNSHKYNQVSNPCIIWQYAS